MPDHPDLIKLRSDAAAVSAQREQTVTAMAQKAAQLATLKAEFTRHVLAGNAAAAKAAQAQHDQIAKQRGQDAATLIRLDNSARDAIGGLVFRRDPCDADPLHPLLLLPLRLETRYTPDNSALRVRIFPDDIHMDQVNHGISEAENAAAVAYWNGVWRGSDTDAPWADFVRKVGKRRATWVALQTQPTNLARRAAEPAPVFQPVSPVAKTGAMARLLPDCFTVVAVQGADTSTAVGKAIASAVPVALFADDGAELKDVNGVKVQAGREWLVDYAEAERIGMAVTLKLKHPGATVDRLFVFGVRVSLDPAAAGKELAALLTAHRCGPGLAFVPQGSPTNNTETNRTTWQRAIEPNAPSRDPLLAPDARSNAAVLASAFGIDSGIVAEIDHAGEREQAGAQAMNVAMWGPSWGSFLDKINKVGSNGAALTQGMRESARVLHRDAVRGRGPIPAIRVGNQPYGVLPVSSLDKDWAVPAGSFEQELLALLRRIRAKWRACLDNVPLLGKGDVDETLRDLLGSTAVSQGLRVRGVVAGPLEQLLPQFIGTPTSDAFLQATIEDLLWEEVIANASLISPVGSLASKSFPLPLPAVDKTDPDFIKATLAGQSPGATSVLQVLIGLAWDRAEQEVQRAGAFGRIGEIIGHVSALAAPDRERILSLATRAEQVDAGVLRTEAERVRQATATATLPTLEEYQPVGAVRRSFGELAIDSTVAANRTRFSGFALQAWLEARARLNELTAALGEIATTEIEERRLLFAEALDLASHRIDAWLTALVETRRQALRAAKSARHHHRCLWLGARHRADGPARARRRLRACTEPHPRGHGRRPAQRLPVSQC